MRVSLIRKPTMIANPGFDLYEKYGIERSTLKLLSSIYKGVIGKAEKGKKLYQQKYEQDGHANRMGAEFLIDENGKIATAWYNQFIGDHLPLKIEAAKRALKQDVKMSMR